MGINYHTKSMIYSASGLRICEDLDMFWTSWMGSLSSLDVMIFLLHDHELHGKRATPPWLHLHPPNPSSSRLTQRKCCCANIAQEGCCKHKDLMTMWHVYMWTFTCNYYIKTPPILQKGNKTSQRFFMVFEKNNIQHNTIIPTALNLSFWKLIPTRRQLVS